MLLLNLTQIIKWVVGKINDLFQDLFDVVVGQFHDVNYGRICHQLSHKIFPTHMSMQLFDFLDDLVKFAGWKLQLLLPIISVANKN